MTTLEAVAWLERLTVPVSVFGSSPSRPAASVEHGMETFLRSSMVRLKERKCRSVSLICNRGLRNVDLFFDLAKEIGLKTRPEWLVQWDSLPDDFEEFGYESFEKIWSKPAKPDGLIVFPDGMTIGVIMAILKLGVQVPKQLKLVMHCNEEIYIHCPLPADWQVVSIAKIVELIWKDLRAQADGETSIQPGAQVTLQPASAELPPILRRWKSG